MRYPQDDTRTCEAVLTIRRIRVLLNAGAGSRNDKDKAQLEETIAGAFRVHGIEARPEFLDGGSLRENLETSLQAAAQGELDAVVVGGGDGTLRTAASILAGSDIPLGILPLGTLNHFAKDMKIPLQLPEAIGVIATGHVASVDVGEVNGLTFINNSSIGIYPYMVLDRERRQRDNNLSKWPAMFLAGLKVLKNLPLRRLSIQGHGSTDVFRSPCVFIGNNAYEATDGSVSGRTTLQEGRLYLYVAKRESRLALFFLALRILTARLSQSRDLRIMPVTEAKIRARRKRLLIACDGEIEFVRTPLHYKIRPLALKVLTPPASGV